MNKPIKIAHLCGPLGQALVIADGETWLYEKNEKWRPTANEVHFFFRNGLEVRPVDPLKEGPLEETNLVELLDLESRKFAALQGLLIGMDGEITDDLRARFMRRAERLLGSQAVSDFIAIRFLRPVTQTWDLAGAVALARKETLPSIQRLYSIVNGDLLLRIEDEIAIWSRQHGYNSVEGAVARENAYESGLVAMVATAAHENDTRAGAKIFLIKNPPWDRRVGAHLVQHFLTKKITTAAAANEAEIDDAMVDSDQDASATISERIARLIEQLKLRQRKQTRGTRGDVGGSALLPVVLGQIDWIAARFQEGHTEAAWNAVVDLAENQLSRGAADKLAMSLTSLATRLVSLSDVAFSLCDLAAQCAPNDPAVATARAELLRKWNRTEEAMIAYDRAVETFPQNVIARNGRAETLRELGRLEEALAAYDRTIEVFPLNDVARDGRAETLRELGRLDEALKAYEITIEAFPQNAYARTGYAETLRGLGRLEEALAAYERAMDLFPQNTVARNGYAETLRNLGRLKEALATYDQTIEAFPQNSVAQCGRAETLRELGRLEEALAAYDLTIKTFPETPVARGGRAETLRQLGRLDEALAAYDRTIEAFPHDVVPRTGRAETLRELGRLEEALAAYERTIEVFAHDIVARTGRAETLRELGRLEDALAAYDRTIEMFPQNAVVQSGQAETLRALGRLEEALATYDRTIRRFPQEVVPRTGQAETLRDLGLQEEALAAYERTIEAFPQNAIARNGHAETLRELGRMTEALIAYDRTIEAFPQDAFARNARAVVLGELGRYVEAKESLNLVVSNPVTREDWVGAHILCMMEFAQGVSEELGKRLMQFAVKCPYYKSRLYFETTLAVLHLALKQTNAARETLNGLSKRNFDLAERAALQFMEAHAKVVEGNLEAARETLRKATNIVSHEEFQLRRMRQGLERRLSLSPTPAHPLHQEIGSADRALVQVEMAFWVDRAVRKAA